MGILPELGDEANVKWTKLDDDPTVHSEISWKVFDVKVPIDQINSKYRMLH